LVLKRPAPTLCRLTVQPAPHRDQRQKLENKNYKGVCVSSHLRIKQPGPTFCDFSLVTASCPQNFVEVNMPAPASLEPAQDVAFARTPSSRHWMQHLPVPPEAGQRSCNSQRQSRSRLVRNFRPMSVLKGHRLSQPQPMSAREALVRDGVLATALSSFLGQKQTSST
jgi:hypothetical protein